jgi:hypothetical protein
LHWGVWISLSDTIPSLSLQILLHHTILGHPDDGQQPRALDTQNLPKSPNYGASTYSATCKRSPRLPHGFRGSSSGCTSQCWCTCWSGLLPMYAPGLMPNYPPTTIEPAQLHIKGKVICSWIKQHIWQATTIPAYLTYVATRFKWNPLVAEMINW